MVFVFCFRSPLSPFFAILLCWQRTALYSPVLFYHFFLHKLGFFSKSNEKCNPLWRRFSSVKVCLHVANEFALCASSVKEILITLASRKKRSFLYYSCSIFSVRLNKFFVKLEIRMKIVTYSESSKMLKKVPHKILS